MKISNNDSMYASCTAHITKQKNRLKLYEQNVHYLNDGDNFEIELFNGWNVQALVKIYINNICIYDSGLILRPGERVFLERFINKNKAFSFETYNVLKEDVENTNIIENNGFIKIEFYKESNINIPIINPWQTPYNNFNKPINEFYYTTHTTPTSTLLGTTSGVNISMQNMSNEVIETGRISEGKETQQSFSIGYGDFNLNPSITKTFQLKPYSSKPITINELKKYCSNCGKKISHKDKYCSNCGVKI